MRLVLEAAAWAAVAASTLVIGAWLGTVQEPSDRRVGLVMGFGAGALIASVSFELTEEAFAVAGGGPVGTGLGLGALAFFVGDLLIDRMGGAERKHARATSAGDADALLLGAALDGVPESLIIGLSLIGGGGVEVAFLVSVAVSNIPEGFASAAPQHRAGVSTAAILGRWAIIVAVSAACGAIGFALFDGLDPRWAAFTQAFAAGALLTMVMDTMAPEAFRDAGPVTGLVAVAGFALAFWLGTL
jgi:zinc transporter, ZIP family